MFTEVARLLNRVGRGVSSFYMGFNVHRRCTVRCLRRVRRRCMGLYNFSPRATIQKQKRRGAVRRERCSGLSRCVSELGGCTRRVGVYKSRHGDCSGASRSTAFVHVGGSCVNGSRLLPNCGVRLNIYSRCVTMFSMGRCTSSVRYFGPLVRGFGRVCRGCPRCPMTSTKCNDFGGCLCYRRRNVGGCVGFAVCRGRDGSGGCQSSPCETMGFPVSASNSPVYPGKGGFRCLCDEPMEKGGCNEARRFCRYRSYDGYLRGRGYYGYGNGHGVHLGRRLAGFRGRILYGLGDVRKTLLHVGQDVRSRNTGNVVG